MLFAHPKCAVLVKVLVCVVGYLVWDMSNTIVNVPYGAMNAAISADPTERAQLSTYRSLGAFSGEYRDHGRAAALLLPTRTTTCWETGSSSSR